MVLKKREKILAIAAAVALAMVAYLYLFAGSRDSPSALRAKRDAKRAELEGKQTRIERARKAAARVTDWGKHALPSNPNDAQRKYQDWLGGLVEGLKFRENDVSSHVSQKQPGIYTSFTFTVKGKVGLEHLVRFLYEFYSAGHLHQVKRLDITAPENARQRDLGVSISIEALSLPDSDRTDRLSQEKPDRPLAAGLDVYIKEIVERNLFAPFSLPKPEVAKPKPPEPKLPPKPVFDHTKFTYVTAITGIDGKPQQVWLHYRPSPPPNGTEVKLSEGEKFDFGELRGTIVRIDWDGVEVEMNGRRRHVARGTNLHDGKELPQ
jgi:hypothetical protein